VTGEPLVTLHFNDSGRWKPKIAETVARRVVQSILDDGLVRGDKLPREAEMVDEYGVGRETLREALRLLETQGLITLRRGPGGGPVVAAAEAVNLGRIETLYFQMVGATYVELVEAWAFAEGVLAERAARNPDAALRWATMSPYFVEPDDAPDTTTVESFMSMHTGFHDELGTLGGNQVLHLTLASFGQIISYQAGVVEDPRLLRQLIHDDHGKLARAVAAGHHRSARSLMENHVGGVWDFLRNDMVAGADGPVRWV
jgi:GntR family transcriptional regulator, transcriptional repressor for pyruvate dehydrogenase complex